MGGASKLLMVLTSPFPLLYPRRSARRLTLHPHIITTASFSSFSKRKLSSVSTTGPLLPFSITLTSEAARTNTANVAREDFDFETEIPSPSPLPNSKISKPWPEWFKLLDSLRSNGYFENLQFELEGENDFSLFENLDEEDAIKMFEKLREEFLSSAKACLAFAHQHSDLLGSLSRKDIEVVVGNGSPFLFVSSVDSARRMKSFLSSDFRIQSVLGNELELDTAHTVDLMRFILSYVYDASAFLDVNGLKNWEMVESSIRNLLSEIADASRGGQEFGLSSPKQHSDGYEQTTSSLGQKLEMKKGDWICAKCSFMNFSRNMKCLECSEERPKRLLTGGEWECPQCDFFNYGRNVECLRCDCKRPGDASFGTVESRSSMGYGNESYLRTGGKTNTRTSRLKKRFSDTTNHGNNLQSMDGASPGSTLSQKLDSVLGRSSSAAEMSPGRSTMSQKLDTILGRSSSAAEMNNDAAAAEETTAGIGRTTFSNTSSPQSWISEANKSGYVPFVPLPADMFGKPQKPTEAEEVLGLQNSAEPKSSGFGQSTDSIPLSEKPVKQIKTKEDEEQDEKSERWSKKVSELHDVTDLASAISDEEFPEIMPMRKGENRFVVSKKKDRSLTSPLQKRQMAMEQTSSTKFVPFVPFPPDYFAKKDKEPETGIASRTSEIQGVPQESEERKIASPNSWAIPDSPLSVNNGQSSENNWNTSLSGKSINKSLADYGPAENSSQIPNDLQTSMGGMGNNGPSPSPIESSAQQFENTKNTKDSWKAGFTGKSLEGSLVKEPDPLDMSEEAKAERWFRRAAQIKDISELSQIPDEDFPQIMPMRKGVNRFVVSKRKTPLERRLTSPQYRRNLPTVSSEPIKENTES